LTRISTAIGMAALCSAIILLSGRADLAAQVIGACSIIVLVIHAGVGTGRFEATAFVAICLGVAFTLENIGAATGFPFGHYAFLVDADLPRIGAIPLIVGALYVGMGYAGWVIASVLLDGSVERPKNVLSLFGRPVSAAFVTTQSDVVMDPPGSTLSKAWAWYDSGGYFGVPLTNFFGWFLTTWLFFQAFAFVGYVRRNRPSQALRSEAFWSIPILLYLSTGLSNIAPLFDANARVTDAGGRVWFAADIRETAAIVALFTMTPTSLLALARLWQRKSTANAANQAHARL
jgi:uncharacterized membrane protein